MTRRRALVMRTAIVATVLLAPLATAADLEGEPEKVSNDRPDRPIQMPAASSETKEAFDDFERFARRGAWERATKSLYSIPEDQAARFVDGPDGFIVSVARKRRMVLAGLSPEGQAAYRLFYDSDAKKLLDKAEGKDEQATLERLFSSYFLTSVGDEAADRLGDLYYEKGEFDRAADCWLAILRERPDSEIPPALLTVKAAMALDRAGRRSELDALRAEEGARFADEVVSLGGRKAKVAEHLRKLPEAARKGDAASAADEGPAPDLAGKAAAWHVRFGDSVTAGMTPAERNQWESTAPSGAVPPVAIAGGRLFANYLGHVFALDLATGKMLWRSASFHNLEQSAQQNQYQNAKGFAVLASPEYVWSLGRDPRDTNYQATTRLVCRRAETGEIVWQSPDLPDYSGLELVGEPILARGTLFLGARTGSSGNYSFYGGSDGARHEYALAVRPHDGKVLWKTDLGTLREGNRYYYYYQGDTTPQPRMTYRAGRLYFDTQQGILARIDADSGTLDWGFGYRTDPVQSGMGRFIVINGMLAMQGTSSSPSAPLWAGDALLVKGAKSDRLCAIDPDRMKLLWERPIAKAARLLGADERSLYLGGADLEAMSRGDRKLLWSAALPEGNDDVRPLVRPDGIWQLTSRGLFEVDPKSGHLRAVVRGDDPGAAGGDLVLTDHLLLTVSNRTISAYPRKATGEAPAVGAEAAANRARGTDD